MKNFMNGIIAMVDILKKDVIFMQMTLAIYNFNSLCFLHQFNKCIKILKLYIIFLNYFIDRIKILIYNKFTV